MAEPYAMSVRRSSARDLELDIFPPSGQDQRACVILLHGGAWMFGHRQTMHPYARELAAAGFTAIAAEYRLIGEAAWPAQVQDVKDVVVWARDHAETNGWRADRIALQGYSAGGHLALLAAATAGQTPNGETTPGERVAAVVSFFAPPQLALAPVGAGPNPVRALLGPQATEREAIGASPLAHIGENFPPTCLLHGTGDAVLPHHATLALFAALEAKNVPVELHLYQGQNHEFCALPSFLAPVQATVAHFLKRVIGDPAFYVEENNRLNPFANGTIPLPPPVNPA